MTDWGNVAAVAIGATAAISGAALAPLVTSGRARRQWRIDKLASACEEYQVALQEAMDFADLVANATIEDEKSGNSGRISAVDMAPAEDMFKRLKRADALVQIYGGKDLRNAVGQATVGFHLLAYFTGKRMESLFNATHHFRTDGIKAEEQIRKELG